MQRSRALPACTTGIPSSGLRAGNRNAPAINAGRKKTRKNPVLSVEVFLHSASIYIAQLKERSSQPVWMPIYKQCSMKIQCSMRLNQRQQHCKIEHCIGGKSPCFFVFIFLVIKSRNLYPFVFNPD